jgi:hypothetical protein
LIWAAPFARQHLVGNLQEVLGEEALPAVDIDDALIEHQIGRRGRDRGRGDPLGGCFLLEGGEPRLEGAGVAAVCLAECRRGSNHQQHRQECPRPPLRLDRHVPASPRFRAACPTDLAVLWRWCFLLVERQLAYPNGGACSEATLQYDESSARGP